MFCKQHKKHNYEPFDNVLKNKLPYFAESCILQMGFFLEEMDTFYGFPNKISLEGTELGCQGGTAHSKMRQSLESPRATDYFI